MSALVRKIGDCASTIVGVRTFTLKFSIHPLSKSRSGQTRLPSGLSQDDFGGHKSRDVLLDGEGGSCSRFGSRNPQKL